MIFVIPATGFWWLREMARTAQERNALAHVRDMVIVHCIRSNGEWPRSWEDLADDFEPANSRYGTQAMDVLKEIVVIDFTIDLNAVLADEAPHDTLLVIRLKHGAESEAVHAINKRLLDYLRAWSRNARSRGPSRDDG